MNARLEIAQLNTLLAVSETGSLSAAAAVVDRSQAALSQQIQALEASCRCTLLTRSVRGARLTQEGEILLSYARPMLELHAGALRALGRQSETVEVILGLPDDYAENLLPRVIALVRSGFTDLRLRLVCAPTPRLQAMHSAGEIDLAIVTVLGGKPGSGHRQNDLCWVAPGGRALPRSSPVPLAVSHPEAVDARCAYDALGAAGIDYQVVCECSSAAAVLAAVRAGLGVAVLARPAIPDWAGALILRTDLPPLPSFKLKLLTGAAPAVSRDLTERITALLKAFAG